MIFFDGEEAFNRWEGKDNTYGARDLASKWQRKLFRSSDGINSNHLERIDVFVLLDLIGAANPKFVALQSSTVEWFSRLVDIERDLTDAGFIRRRRDPYFNNKKFFNARIEDDHVPFMKRGVPILHLISVPFPDVWHKITDNESAVDYATVAEINKILRVFVATYLQMEWRGGEDKKSDQTEHQHDPTEL